MFHSFPLRISALKEPPSGDQMTRLDSTRHSHHHCYHKYSVNARLAASAEKGHELCRPGPPSRSPRCAGRSPTAASTSSRMAGRGRRELPTSTSASSWMTQRTGACASPMAASTHWWLESCVPTPCRARPSSAAWRLGSSPAAFHTSILPLFTCTCARPRRAAESALTRLGTVTT